MAKSPNWSSEELELLKENYPKLGKCEELALLFPARKLQAVCLKASRIGLKVINNVKAGRTNEEYLALLVATNFESLEPYKGSTEPIKHRCKICSNEWYPRPQHVLKEGAKCPVCDLKSRTNTTEYVDEVLDKAHILRHNEYTGSFHPLSLEHLDCGYTWTTKFSYIQQGSGCPLCNRGFGYEYSKDQMPSKAILYLLKITAGGEVFLKVGITVRKTSSRVRELRARFEEVVPSIEVLAELVGSGADVVQKEKRLLETYQKHHTRLYFPGNTELVCYNELESILKEYNE